MDSMNRLLKALLYPGKKWLVVIFFLSMLIPLEYVYWGYFHPDGYVFAGFRADEAMQLAAMKSYLWNFNTPWSQKDISVFHDPILGSPYILVSLGMVALITKLNPLFLLAISKGIFAFFYLIAVYHLMGRLIRKREKDIAFFFFAVTQGISGLAYIFLAGNVPTGHLVWGGILSTTKVIFYSVPLMTGCLSLIFLMDFIKDRSMKCLLASDILLGLTILFYPLYGACFFMISAIYLLCTKKFIHIFGLLPSLVFVIPWIMAYLQTSISFYPYLTTRIYTNVVAFIANSGFVLLFALLYLFYFFRQSPRNETDIFVVFWLLFMLILVLMPAELSFWYPPRFTNIIFIPLSIAGAKGVELLVKKRLNLLMAIILIISVPSFVFAIININSQGIYLTEDEFNALLFLKGQPDGTVMASERIGLFVPYYSEKKSLTGRVVPFGDSEKDYDTFYLDEKERSHIIEKYEIIYIYFCKDEREKGITDLGLERIYESGDVLIYKTS
jgi:hypothetical protein